jgi:hypothetical protein
VLVRARINSSPTEPLFSPQSLGCKREDELQTSREYELIGIHSDKMLQPSMGHALLPLATAALVCGSEHGDADGCVAMKEKAQRAVLRLPALF